MKKYISIIIVAACTIVLVGSCSKKLDKIGAASGIDGMAFIKVGQFSPNFRLVVNNRDSINVYANGVKLNGTFLTFGSYFPSTTNLYAAVPPGILAIKITVNGVTTPDSVTLATFNKTLSAGSYYSFILTDSLLNTNESKQIFVQDNFVLSDTLHYSIRFMHSILSDTAGKNVDVYSSRLGTNMFSNVAPGTVSAFTSQNYTLTTDTLIVRRAGGLFELARLNAAVLARQRAYTLLYKGLPATTTGSKARSLGIYTNQ
jgi:hypothetical protein